MNYIDSNLRRDESVVVKAKISFLYLIPGVIGLVIALAIAIVLSVVVFKSDQSSSGSSNSLIGDTNQIFSVLRIIVWIIAGLAGGVPFIKRILVILTTHLAVTNKRVVGKSGILKIQTLDIPIDKLDNVSFSASAFGNLFHYADVVVKSVGSDGWAFHGVSNAQAFKDCATDAIEKHAAQARKDQAEQIAMAMNGKA